MDITETDEVNLGEGDYVAVRVSRAKREYMFMAKVLEIEEEGNIVKMHFMKRNSKGGIYD